MMRFLQDTIHIIMTTLYIEQNPEAWDITPVTLEEYFGFVPKDVIDLRMTPRNDWVDTTFILHDGRQVHVLNNDVHVVIDEDK